MSFNDIFKSSFLENVSEFSILDTVIGLAVALVIGLFIFIIYKKTLTGVLYSSGFALTLVGLSLVTTLVIMAVTSNVVLSLGMVGALSIVRFRNAVKDPMDLVFLFWSISIGIVCGAKLYALAILLSLVLTVLVFVLDLIPAAKSPMLLVMNGSDASVEAALQPILKQQAKAAHVKSRNLTTAGIDLIVELRPNDPPALVQACAALPGVQSVSLLDHDGQIRY